jgi:predicted lipoprotein with Yx(FWY)xxD motif
MRPLGRASISHGTRSSRLAAVIVALTCCASLVAFGAAATRTLTVGAEQNASLGKSVAVSPAGRTLYELSGETTHHLLCTGRACMQFWPPVIVPRGDRLHAGPGLHGKLGTLHRAGGKIQATLNGKPLYRYSGDRGHNEANGEGIESFGGTWHAVPAAPAASMPAPAAPAAPSPSPSSPSPGGSGGYPGY